MKGFSFIIEALAFFIAIALLYLLSNKIFISPENKFISSMQECKTGEKCYEGYIPFSKEELKKMNISVIGEGAYGVMYLNNESRFILRLR